MPRGRPAPAPGSGSCCACSTRRMMPASIVCSPVPVTSIRSEPARSRCRRSPGRRRCFSTGRDSPVIIDSLTRLCPRAPRHPPAHSRPGGPAPRRPLAARHGHLLESLSRALATIRDGHIRQQLRQLGERALRLADRAHLDPVAQQHDRDEGRELFPERHPGVAERHGQAEDEGDVIASAISVIMPGSRPGARARRPR